MTRRKPGAGAGGRPDKRVRSGNGSTIRDLRARLEEREAIGAAVIATALDCIIVVDQTGAIVEFNATAERTFGHRRDAVIGRRIAEVIVPPEQREAHRAGFARYLATGEARLLGRRVEVTALHADGHHFPIELAISEVRLDHARYFTAYLRDITARRSAESALRESEGRYALAVDGSSEGIYDWNIRQDSVYYSHRLYELFGNPPAATWLRPGGWFNLVHPDDLPALRDTIANYLKQGAGTLAVEYRIIRPDGQVRWMSTNGALLRDQSGRAIRMAGSTGDITDRKRFEQVLRESELRFRSIAEAQPVPIVIVRQDDGRIAYANPAAQSLLGAETALPGTAFADCFVDSAEAAPLRSSVGNTGSIDATETRLRGARKVEFPAGISVRPLTYDGVACIAVGIVDLTERERAEAQIARQREALHQSEKLTALGSLLAGVAHELNNPLSVVIAQASLLRETAIDAAIAARAAKIGAAAERCGRIVKTFLAMARQRPATHGETDINRLIEEALEIASYGIRTAGVKVECEFPADLPALWADPDQLSQVLLNLVVNAQQAMADHPGSRLLRLTTRFLPGERAIRIEVSDSGAGIPAEIRQRIFEPFFTTKPVGAGTGVGLAVCHSIVAAHGGSIALLDAPGGGARFVVTLPLGSRIVRSAETPPPAEIDLTDLRILVVDDETEIGESIREMLQRDGHRVDVVEGGRAALEQVAAQEYDLIISDLRMADVSGSDLYRALRKKDAGLADRVIFITGDTFGSGAAMAIDGQAVPVVEKPFSLADLRGAMARRLDLA